MRSAKLVLPKGVAKHGDAVRAHFCVLFGQKAAAQNGRDTEEGEVVAGNQLGDNALGAFLGSQFGCDARVSNGPVEHSGVPADGIVVRATGIVGNWFAGGRSGLDGPQFVGIGNGLRAEQQLVKDCKERKVRPDAEREREHGDSGETRVLQQLAVGEIEIVHVR